MYRRIAFQLNRVSPTPSSLRRLPSIDAPASEVAVDLARLFLHYYFDSYPAGPPKPDPTRFEYLELVSSADDFRFHAHVANASSVKRRAISTELGQAFCRLMLEAHFGIRYFAHMSSVLGRRTHAAFDGLQISRALKGDVPDYLCARKTTEPFIAEAKGRFSSIPSFAVGDWPDWRAQFTRIRVESPDGLPRRLKGYIVATRLATDASSSRVRTTAFIEDPEVPGEGSLLDTQRRALGRAAAAIHYGRVFSKLSLPLFAGALSDGWSLTRDLSFQIPVWACQAPPFEGRRFIGGFYRTAEGSVPSLTSSGWQMPLDLGRGHLAFVGLALDVAQEVGVAARGQWDRLDDLPVVEPTLGYSSEVGWLPDGTICAPVEYFLPTGSATL